MFRYLGLQPHEGGCVQRSRIIPVALSMYTETDRQTNRNKPKHTTPVGQSCLQQHQQVPAATSLRLHTATACCFLQCTITTAPSGSGHLHTCQPGASTPPLQRATPPATYTRGWPGLSRARMHPASLHQHEATTGGWPCGCRACKRHMTVVHATATTHDTTTRKTTHTPKACHATCSWRPLLLQRPHTHTRASTHTPAAAAHLDTAAAALSLSHTHTRSRCI